jgi:uncharacterized protein (DUF2141 family)
MMMRANRASWRRVPAVLLSLLSLTLMRSVLANDATVRVIAMNVASDRGNVVVWVYKGEDQWLGDDFFRSQSVPVAGNRTGDEVIVEVALPAGEYALSVFQDVDADGKLKRNFIGIPKEPAGLSNNAVPRFGPPRYKDARFVVGSAGVEQRIRLE